MAGMARYGVELADLILFMLRQPGRRIQRYTRATIVCECMKQIQLPRFNHYHKCIASLYKKAEP
jgi:hypothetical protein